MSKNMKCIPINQNNGLLFEIVTCCYKCSFAYSVLGSVQGRFIYMGRDLKNHDGSSCFNIGKNYFYRS